MYSLFSSIKKLLKLTLFVTFFLYLLSPLNLAPIFSMGNVSMFCVFFFILGSLIFQLSQSTTVVVDGVSLWKNPIVHIDDSISKRSTSFLCIMNHFLFLLLFLFDQIFFLQFFSISMSIMCTFSRIRMPSMPAISLKLHFLLNLIPSLIL